MQDVLKTLEPEARPRKKQTLSQALGLLETSAPPPTDEEIKQWLEEHRAEKFRTCLEAFEICDVTRHTLQQAETLSGNDFEDNLQIACATLQNLNAIVTRDKAGFQNSSVAVFDPADLLAQL